MTDTAFAEVVMTDLVEPLKELCAVFEAEGAMAEFGFFSGLLFMMSDPDDEVQILAAVIELSKCAFLGFSYSVEATTRIDSLLDRAITLSHTMSGGGDAH